MLSATTPREYTQMVSSVYPCFRCNRQAVNQPLTHVTLIESDFGDESGYFCDLCFFQCRLEGRL